MYTSYTSINFSLIALSVILGHTVQCLHIPVDRLYHQMGDLSTGWYGEGLQLLIGCGKYINGF